jgi:homoserine kinase type II
VGGWMAKMHTTAERFPFYRHNSLALDGLQKIFASVRGQVNTIAPNLEKDIDEEITFLRRSWPYGLPSGIIHGDVFPDNVFFTGNDTVKPKLSGVIDFYFSCSDFWIYDVLICINAWCFDPQNRRFLPTRAKILFEGYGKVRTVTMPEKQAMPTLARAAALRFLLTRCRDWINRVDGAMVATKDPMEYFDKLRFHREVRGYWNYGL